MTEFWSMLASIGPQPDFPAASDWLTKAVDLIEQWFESFMSWIRGFSAANTPFSVSAKYLFSCFLLTVFCGGQLWLLYLLVGFPLRRQERARLFLDLLEAGLKEGRSVENTIISLSNSRDRTLRIWFHLLAAYLESGLTFIEGLKKVPRLLPRAVVAMLEAGVQIGDIGKVLPASRKLLTDGNSRVRVTMNHMIVLMISSSALNIWLFLSGRILWRLRAIVWDVSNDFPIVAGFPVLVRVVLDHSSAVTIILWSLTIFLWLSLFLYIGGQHWIPGFLKLFLKPWSDRIFFRLPWCRKRLQRDFSSILAILLDAEVPEEQAVMLAAHGAGNGVLIRRAGAAVEELRQGMTLTQVMRHFDDTGEFQWRLTNVFHVRTGFLEALSGWHEVLDAQAFQGEQAASQIMTTLLVLLNGIMIGLIVAGVFQLLVFVIQREALW